MTLVSNSIDEVRKRANEILKGVDQLIKAGKLDHAGQELARAKEIDPNNGYIRAFEERIAFLKEEENRKKGVDAARMQMEENARKKLEDERRRVEEDRRKKEQEIIKRIHEAHGKRVETASGRLTSVPTSAPAPAPVSVPPPSPAPLQAPAPVLPVSGGNATDERRKIEEQAKRKFEEEFRKAEANNRKKTAEGGEAPALGQFSASDGPAMYKRVLLLAWADGALTTEERKQLKDMRAALKISQEDHDRLEAEAKEESYSHAFELVWNSGLGVHERSKVVSELRQKFQLSPDVYSRIESRIIPTIDAGQQQQPIIYVVDDEDEFLKLIARVLENAGFQVKAFNTSDEAYKDLQKESPHLILSDINLETSSAGGFTFYERVRQLDHLLNVPFIFLSGMADEGMIRYGKGLGADDYLTKPFSSDLLLDTVKGKLKRFRPFRKN